MMTSKMGIDIAVAGAFAILFYLAVSTVYNLWFHPLSKYPGPFFSRISGIPSFYHACTGQRHIWTWRQFQIYGDKFRAAPNLLLFQTPEANDSIFGPGANVKKSSFYDVWRRNKHDLNTLGTTDIATHVRRRKALALAFTERSLQANIPFMIRHVDRWNELLVEDTAEGWSEPRDLAEWSDYLMFDMFGDICFGKTNNTKEPGPNPLKSIPKDIASYLRLYNPIAKSPFRGLLLWLKPRGLDTLMEAMTPKNIKDYYTFSADIARTRTLSERNNEQSKLEKGEKKREDMFHFLSTATNPDTGEYAMPLEELIADANLLIVAGSDTTSTTTTALIFFITHYPRVYAKLVKEIRENFKSVEEIGTGRDFMAKCEYLRAVIDETLRLAPAGPSELERTVLPGGTIVAGEAIPEGITVGVPNWSLARNEDIWGDSTTFRPERWIVSDHPDTLNTQDEVNRLKRCYHPFGKGVGVCLGKKMAMIELCIVMARTLWRFDVRQAPGTSVGEGHPGLGWGRRNKNHFMVIDAVVSLRQGPIVQFRKRGE